MNNPIVAVLLFSLLSSFSWAQEQVTDTVPLIPMIEDSSTGALFPESLIPLKGSRHTLVSTGVRKKFIFKVYAFALYLDFVKGFDSLSPWSDKDPDYLYNDKNLVEEMLSGEIGMTIVWALQRDVDATDIAEAFDDSLGPRVDALLSVASISSTLPRKPEKRAKLKKNTKDSLAVFRGFFGEEEIKEGTEIVFSWLPSGLFRTRIGEDRKVDIKSDILGRAFFDVYLGLDPITRLGRERFYEGLSTMLSSEISTGQEVPFLDNRRKK